MNRDQVLNALFADGWKAEYMEADHFYGRATVGNQQVTVIGTAEKAEVGADMALTMARVVIETIKQRPGVARQRWQAPLCHGRHSSLGGR